MPGGIYHSLHRHVISVPIIKFSITHVPYLKDLELQVGPVLVTHWGFSGPAILRLSAWGACVLAGSGYKGKEILLFLFNFSGHIFHYV